MLLQLIQMPVGCQRQEGSHFAAWRMQKGEGPALVASLIPFPGIALHQQKEPGGDSKAPQHCSLPNLEQCCECRIAFPQPRLLWVAHPCLDRAKSGPSPAVSAAAARRRRRKRRRAHAAPCGSTAAGRQRVAEICASPCRATAVPAPLPSWLHSDIQDT